MFCLLVLLGYGFIIPDNVCDYFSIGFKVPSGSPLEDARKIEIQIRAAVSLPPQKENDRIYHVYNLRHPFPSTTSELRGTLEGSLFSQDLWNAVSILCANNRELATMTHDNSTSWLVLGDHPWCCRNHLNTIAQLLAECRARVIRLQNLQNISQEPANRQQRQAQIFLAGQTRTLQAAVTILAYSLQKATSLPDVWAARNDTEYLQTLCTDPDLIDNVSHAVLKHPLRLVEHAGELLSPARLMNNLCRDNLFDLKDTLLASSVDSTQPNTLARTWFVTLVAYLRLKGPASSDDGSRQPSSERRMQIPERFAEWIADMEVIYPAEECPSDPLDELFSYEPALSRYRDVFKVALQRYPNLPLTWALQVIDEEGVNIPKEDMTTEYFLYIPQLET